MAFSWKQLLIDLKTPSNNSRPVIIVNLILAALALAGTFLSNRLAVPYYQELDQKTGPIVTKLMIGCVVSFMGLVACLFKDANQRGYGYVEVIFGVLNAFFIAFNMTPAKATLPQWASLVACAYVISRGLNNVRDSLKLKPV